MAGTAGSIGTLRFALRSPLRQGISSHSEIPDQVGDEGDRIGDEGDRIGDEGDRVGMMALRQAQGPGCDGLTNRRG